MGRDKGQIEYLFIYTDAVYNEIVQTYVDTKLCKIISKIN